MPELGYDESGLIAECENALSFGFSPQICTEYPGKLFWETLFLESIKSFVRPTKQGHAAQLARERAVGLGHRG